MCRYRRGAILLLVCMAGSTLNFGCGGGGGLPRTTTPATQTSQGLQTGSGSSRFMQAPILGFAYAAGSSEVRTINGIPGASVLSPPIVLPDGITAIVFAPGQKSALVESANSTSIGVVSFLSAEPGPITPVAGAIAQPDIIVFSPSGAAAALYSTAEGKLQVIGGLRDRPQVTRNLTADELPDPARTFAIADDGVTLLEGTVNSGVYLLASGGAQLLENVSDLGAIVFNPSSNDALILDRSGNTLSLLQSVSSAPASRTLASGLTGLDGNIVLQTNGRTAVVTSINANHLWEVDLRSYQTQELPLSTTPAMLQPLRISGEYLLAWQPGQLAWIVDTNAPKGAVYLVPTAAPAQAALAR